MIPMTGEILEKHLHEYIDDEDCVNILKFPNNFEVHQLALFLLRHMTKKKPILLSRS
jgi:hypothetical protein